MQKLKSPTNIRPTPTTIMPKVMLIAIPITVAATLLVCLIGTYLYTQAHPERILLKRIQSDEKPWE
jgi:hypothetical protein